MPRPKLIEQSVFPYSLTGRSNNKDWFAIHPRSCWKIFEEVIAKTAERYGVQTHCFVLMSNHYHWLVTTPNSNLGQAMRYFMTETSRKIARKSGRINKIYGTRYKPTLITDPGYYANTYRYFIQNPLRQRMCAHTDLYPWTSRSKRARIELTANPAFEIYIPTDNRTLKRWLNKIPDGPYEEMMKKALRRSTFKFSPHPTNKYAMPATSFLEELETKKPASNDAGCGGKTTSTFRADAD